WREGNRTRKRSCSISRKVTSGMATLDERMVRAQTNVNRESRIRPMVEADAEVVAELATELGYPNEIEAIRRRIRPIGEADLLLVATDARDKPIGLIRAHRVCIIEVGFRVEILGLVVSSIAPRKGIARMLIGE